MGPAGPEGGAPLRCCLRYSEPGDARALIAYQPSTSGGPYAEIGPVFVHAERCAGWAGPGYPDAFTDRPQVFRAYDHDGAIADAVLVKPGGHEDAIATLLANGETSRIDTRNVLRGCVMATITRRLVTGDEFGDAGPAAAIVGACSPEHRCQAGHGERGAAMANMAPRSPTTSANRPMSDGLTRTPR